MSEGHLLSTHTCRSAYAARKRMMIVSLCLLGAALIRLRSALILHKRCSHCANECWVTRACARVCTLYTHLVSYSFARTHIEIYFGLSFSKAIPILLVRTIFIDFSFRAAEIHAHTRTKNSATDFFFPTDDGEFRDEDESTKVYLDRDNARISEI